MLLVALAAASSGRADEAPRAVFEFRWDSGEYHPAGAEWQLGAAEWQLAGVDLAVRDFPLDWLHTIEDVPAAIVHPSDCGREAPCIWGGHVVVAGVSLDVSFLTVLRRGRDLEWMYAHRISRGNYRFDNGRKSWWVCRDGRSYQIARRYPEDLVEVRAEIRRYQGFEPDEDDVASRVEAGRALNADVEAFLAKGLTLEDARLATMRVAIEIAQQLGLAYFHAFAAAHASLQLARDIGGDMDAALNIVRASKAPSERSEDLYELAELTRHPPNDGFVGAPTVKTLRRGLIIDRYGGTDGSRFFCPAGACRSSRSMEPKTEVQPLRRFRVLQPLRVEAGRVASWYAQPGGGQQLRTSLTLKQLLDSRVLEEIP